MAGALTANAVRGTVAATNVTDAETPCATIEFLSPVDGANNVLLTAVLLLQISETEDFLTFQWYRGQTGATVADATLGTPVGDPFTIDNAEIVQTDAQVCVAAIDRGAGLTSGYVLTVVNDGTGTDAVADGYVDAVLYD